MYFCFGPPLCPVRPVYLSQHSIVHTSYARSPFQQRKRPEACSQGTDVSTAMWWPVSDSRLRLFNPDEQTSCDIVWNLERKL